MKRLVVLMFLVLLGVTGGAATGAAAASPRSVTGVVPAAGGLPAVAASTTGTFSALTYNVAGLPEPLSSGSPKANTPTIGERIRDYDLVNVQEDFNYHAALYAADNHPYRTPTSGGVPFGDGLNTLSRFPYSDFQRVTWTQCNGTDCLTPKGFSLARITLAEGAFLDLYNVHANAGSTDADLAARRANITQLSQFITAHSAGNAVVVMGDTNTRYTRTGDNIRTLLAENGLTDAWVELVRGGQAPAAGDPALVCDAAAVTDTCEVVDKVLYRSGPLLTLRATSYHNENAAFLDAAGAPLSDHYPHAVGFRWTLSDTLRASAQFGGPHGTPFNDAAALPAGAAPRSVTLRGGSRLDGVSTLLTTGTTLKHGGDGGSASTLTLASGEHLTEVTLTQGQKDGRTRVFSASLRTSQGRVLSAGTPTADTVTYRAPTGWRIVGFTGRSGTEIDKLGVLYAPA